MLRFKTPDLNPFLQVTDSVAGEVLIALKLNNLIESLKAGENNGSRYIPYEVEQS